MAREEAEKKASLYLFGYRHQFVLRIAVVNNSTRKKKSDCTALFPSSLFQGTIILECI